MLGGVVRETWMSMVGIMKKSNVCMLILMGVWVGLCTCSAWADDGASELTATLRSIHEVAQNVVSDSDETQAEKDSFKDAINDTAIPDDETPREIASDGVSNPSENTPSESTQETTNEPAQQTSAPNALASVFSPNLVFAFIKTIIR